MDLSKAFHRIAAGLDERPRKEACRKQQDDQSDEPETLAQAQRLRQTTGLLHAAEQDEVRTEYGDAVQH